MGQACSVTINACQPVYISMYSELFQLPLQRQRRLMHDKQTQVLDAVDVVDIGVTAIEPSYTQLQAASMSSSSYQ